MLKPELTGFVAVKKQLNYSDIINMNFEENSEYVWIPEHQGLLESLKISGSYKTEGNVRVYLEDEGIKYLIFDSNKLNETGIAGITGLAISNESNNQDNDSNNNENNNNDSNENNNLIINEPIEINETETIINQTTEEINKTITQNLEYGNNEFYDSNNDGIEDIYGVVDLAVENSLFSWEADEKTMHKMEY